MLDGGYQKLNFQNSLNFKKHLVKVDIRCTIINEQIEKKLNILFYKYAPKDIFNADVKALFFKDFDRENISLQMR